MDLGWQELVILLVILMIFFGAKKMPDAARSLGRSLRIFKSEMKGLTQDDDQVAGREELPEKTVAARQEPPAQQAPTAPQVPVASSPHPPSAGSEPAAVARSAGDRPDS